MNKNVTNVNEINLQIGTTKCKLNPVNTAICTNNTITPQPPRDKNPVRQSAAAPPARPKQNTSQSGGHPRARARIR